MSLVTYKTVDRISFISLNRADKRNALNSQMVSELKEAFQQAELDETSKVIVLKAEGKVFSAGADLAYLQELQSNTLDENYADSSHLKELFEQIYWNKKLVIAQVEGHAIAGGCGLATVCDLVYCVPEATLGYTEVKIGFIPAIVMFFLLRKIGEQKAKDLLLTGRLIKADEARKLGLINEVVATEHIANKVIEKAQEIIRSCSSDSIALTKEMIADIQSMEAKEALDYAARKNAQARDSSDCKKGISAFLSKEKIIW